MATDLFECHITLEPIAYDSDRQVLEWLCGDHKFKHSEIAGDPVLGQNKYFYLTGHDGDFNKMKTRMDRMADDVGKLCRAKVVRKKIEQIVYDVRTP